MNVLLSFVGNQDPLSEKTNEEGAVLTLCRRLRPELIYLLPSAEGYGVRSSTEENARMTQEWLKEVLPESACYVRPLSLSDPTNFDELLPQVKKSVSGILAEVGKVAGDWEVHLNCSSGTPQMTACWYVLANSGHIPGARLWQVHNPQLVSPGERVREIRVTFLEEENIIGRIYRSLPELLFGVMARECRRLEEISLYSGRRGMAGLMAGAFEAYALWDLLQYREAYQRLASIERRWRNTVDAGQAAVLLGRQTSFLRELSGESKVETRENLIDVYFNAERCLARHAYADTLARFWRIYEGIIYYRLREVWGIEPLDITRSRNESHAKKAREVVNTGQALSRFRAAELLKHQLGDGEFKRALETGITASRPGSPQPMKLEKLLEELRAKRNSSVAAHGMQPVAREDAENSLKAARVLLACLLPNGQEVLDAYPLRSELIRELVDLLARS